jgi:thiol-disulfide isomerase/thioredoxin
MKKNNEWCTYCKDEGRYIYKKSKNELIYHLRDKNDSKYVNLRKNKLVVSIAVVAN